MITESSELQSLNFRFLLLLQREAKQDPQSAARIFGLDASDCEGIASMSLDEIENLAKSNALVFRCRLDRPLRTLLSATTSPGVRAVLIESRS